jgi:hypothetical protein
MTPFNSPVCVVQRKCGNYSQFIIPPRIKFTKKNKYIVLASGFFKDFSTLGLAHGLIIGIAKG